MQTQTNPTPGSASLREAQLAQALQPILEQTLHESVRRNPKMIVDLIYPVIGPAIRRSVAAALRTMADSLNRVLEDSLTFRSVGWRLESMRTGRPYGEIALLRSVHYAVEQVFLIHRATGLLLKHVVAEEAVIKDPDLVSAMLTAIQDFVRDSFGASAEGFEAIQVDEFTIWVQHGPRAVLAGVIRGLPPEQLKTIFHEALERIHREAAGELERFAGDPAPFESTAPVLRTCLFGRPGMQAGRRHYTLWILLGVVTAAALFWIFTTVRDQRRLEAYVGRLEREPGIVVTGTSRAGGRYTIDGLRDPASRDPLLLAPGTGIAAERIDSHWQPYFSAHPRFVAARKVEALAESLDKRIIRFDPASARIRDEQMDTLEEVAAEGKELFELAGRLGWNVRIKVLARTDPTGTGEFNARLAQDRAAAVESALTALGIEQSRLVTVAQGVEPLRKGSTERDLAMNRSVSFQFVSPAKAGWEPAPRRQQ